eukprot:CAMPEP_0180258582 /NCGR_PEP_ID=MMETSP0987-20121128/42493_1 /TAXON_ID=697907 /ORGANISM="non described non described, Strain CCMP2293" /LENGTH=77 /DNA_ID=CAMNT_0022228091 /DNA_START=1 /DNA_END=231 /DNA_ORIENTATION=-
MNAAEALSPQRTSACAWTAARYALPPDNSLRPRSSRAHQHPIPNPARWGALALAESSADAAAHVTLGRRPPRKLSPV